MRAVLRLDPIARVAASAIVINEAVAVQVPACLDAWRVDPVIINAAAGAIALGHLHRRRPCAPAPGAR